MCFCPLKKAPLSRGVRKCLPDENASPTFVTTGDYQTKQPREKNFFRQLQVSVSTPHTCNDFLFT